MCILDERGVTLEPGSLGGDKYCQVFLQVEMIECDGCPDYTRRVEIYSNRDTGCGLEFYAEPDTTDPTDDGDNTDTDDTDPDNTNPDNTDPDDTDPDDTDTDPTPTTPTPPGDNEDDSSNSLVTSSILAVLSAILLNNY